MMRATLSTLCLFALAGFVSAEEKKADKAGETVSGRFKEWKNGNLIIVSGKKGEESTV